MNDPDTVPDFPPRVIEIYWEPGKDLILEAPSLADWEVLAVLRELVGQYETVNEDETQEP